MARGGTSRGRSYGHLARLKLTGRRRSRCRHVAIARRQGSDFAYLGRRQRGRALLKHFTRAVAPVEVMALRSTTSAGGTCVRGGMAAALRTNAGHTRQIQQGGRDLLSDGLDEVGPRAGRRLEPGAQARGECVATGSHGRALRAGTARGHQRAHEPIRLDDMARTTRRAIQAMFACSAGMEERRWRWRKPDMARCRLRGGGACGAMAAEGWDERAVVRWSREDGTIVVGISAWLSVGQGGLLGGQLPAAGTPAATSFYL